MSINKVILLGYLGSDPEIGLTKYDRPRCTLRLATNRITQPGHQHATDWHNVIAFDDLATYCSKHAVRGRELFVEGRLSYWSTTDPVTNESRLAVTVIATSVLFVGQETLSTLEVAQS